MEKIIRCYRYAIVPSSVQREGLLREKEQREVSGVTCLFVRYCTLRSHLLMTSRAGRGLRYSVQWSAVGMRGFGW
jgi:hypothetical protein